MREVRMGVIGLGNMGSAHAACIAGGEIAGMRLASVCDIHAEKLSAFTAEHPSVRGFLNWQEMLTDAETDGVILAVPHPLHGKMAIPFLEMNKHVLVEKPVDITVSKAKAINAVAARSSAVFGIMFNQRTHPLYRQTREIVQSGQLGELKRISWIVTNWYRTQTYYDSSSWRATWVGEGGGVLLNQAVHNLDLWQWICGMPMAVYADCPVGKYHRIEVEDEATIYARYANGATGVFVTGTGEYPGTNRLEIGGDNGKLVIENGTLKQWRLSIPESRARFSAEEMGYPGEVLVSETVLTHEPQDGHLKILQNFADAVRNGASLIAPGTDGLFSLELANGAYLSSWSKQEIPLPLNDDHFDAELQRRRGASRCRSETRQDIAGKKRGYADRWQVKW